MSAEPAWDGYFADPFLLTTDDGWVAYGSSGPDPDVRGSVRALVSKDLRTWRSAGTVLDLDPAVGTDVWAPEVLHADGAWWMYSSAGFGIDGHHLRVARADSPLGPFMDQGLNLTPAESFAIDPSPFTDADGQRYLYFARDVLDAELPGTHLAVRRMRSPVELDPETVPVLAPNALWQRYEADRAMYGRRLDWYTLEGPTVVRQGRGYVLLYSGGSWETPEYGVSYATAPTALGPWRHASADVPLVLSRALTGLRGPGHNSLLRAGDGWVTAFHTWDEDGVRRRMHVAPVRWRDGAPVVDLGAG